MSELEEFTKQEQKAREHTERLLGPEPKGDWVSAGTVAFFATSAVPYFGLRLGGVREEVIGSALLVTGLVCGAVSAIYVKRRRDRWSKMHVRVLAGYRGEADSQA